MRPGPSVLARCLRRRRSDRVDDESLEIVDLEEHLAAAAVREADRRWLQGHTAHDLALPLELPRLAKDADDTRRVFTITVAALIGEVAILGILGLIITHRVCGPIFVITRHINTMVEGKHPSLRPLRQGDEFAAMFLSFQRLIDGNKAKDKDDVDKLKPIIAAVRTLGLADTDVAVLQALVDQREARLDEKR